MEADFEPEDKYSWFFGPLSRGETNDILQNKQEGVFLVRSSTSKAGDFVLCVKEEKVSHYIINRIQVSGITRFKIGDKEFDNIPSLLKFYKSHYLDTTTLIRPAPRQKLRGKFDFAGKDPEDLPFKTGDILELISKDEEEWWMARDIHGRVGQIPVQYTTKIEDTSSVPENSVTRKLPALARVKLDRVPSAYDPTGLRLKKGEVIKVLVINIDGQWEGEVNGRTGKFPFTHVEFISEDELPPT